MAPEELELAISRIQEADLETNPKERDRQFAVLVHEFERASVLHKEDACPWFLLGYAKQLHRGTGPASDDVVHDLECAISIEGSWAEPRLQLALELEGLGRWADVHDVLSDQRADVESLAPWRRAIWDAAKVAASIRVGNLHDAATALASLSEVWSDPKETPEEYPVPSDLLTTLSEAGEAVSESLRPQLMTWLRLVEARSNHPPSERQAAFIRTLWTGTPS